MESKREGRLSQLRARVIDRTRGSRARRENCRRWLADSRAVAGLRGVVKDMLYPVVGERAQGARFWDVDGNEYVDLTMGFGVQLFGHGAPFITDAVNAQLCKGLHLGPQASLAGEVARGICELTGVERVCFCNSGTEAVMTALRLARAATGRDRTAMFKWSYHGNFDATLGRPRKTSQCDSVIPLAPGVAPKFVEDLIMLDYGEQAAFEILDRHAAELAAVIVEPVQSLRPQVQPREFLHELRRWTEAHGVALVFDDILLGFRIDQAGSQAHFGVVADLVTYGKIIGGGLPIGVVGGASAFMDGIDGGSWAFGDNGAPKGKRTFFAGTFNKNPMTMATSAAVLAELRRRGPGLQQGLNARTARLAERLNADFEAGQLPLRVVHFGSMFRFTAPGNLDLLFYDLLARGVYVWEGRSCFLSTAHTDTDIEFVIDAVAQSARFLRDAELLGG